MIVILPCSILMFPESINPRQHSTAQDVFSTIRNYFCRSLNMNQSNILFWLLCGLDIYKKSFMFQTEFNDKNNPSIACLDCTARNFV